MARKNIKKNIIGDIFAEQKKVGLEDKWIPYIHIAGKPVALADKENPSGYVECETEEQALEEAQRVYRYLVS